MSATADHMLFQAVKTSAVMGRQQAIALHNSTVRFLEERHGLSDFPESFQPAPNQSHKADHQVAESYSRTRPAPVIRGTTIERLVHAHKRHSRIESGRCQIGSHADDRDRLNPQHYPVIRGSGRLGRNQHRAVSPPLTTEYRS